MCFKQNRAVKSKRVQYDQSIYHANVNVNLMIEDVIQIRSGITMCLDASAKTLKIVVFGILLHVVANMVNI